MGENSDMRSSLGSCSSVESPCISEKGGFLDRFVLDLQRRGLHEEIPSAEVLLLDNTCVKRWKA